MAAIGSAGPGVAERTSRSTNDYLLDDGYTSLAVEPFTVTR
jgi:hypothetical protein